MFPFRDKSTFNQIIWIFFLILTTYFCFRSAPSNTIAHHHAPFHTTLHHPAPPCTIRHYPSPFPTATHHSTPPRTTQHHHNTPHYPTLPSAIPHHQAPSHITQRHPSTTLNHPAQLSAITHNPAPFNITKHHSTQPSTVTPILSRMLERLVVRDHISPTIPPGKLFDQYGFKPTGSTTSALIDITHTVSIMLEDIKYVRCLLIDFSKAFDSVDHLVLINKLKKYNIADNIIK